MSTSNNAERIVFMILDVQCDSHPDDVILLRRSCSVYDVLISTPFG